MGRYLYILIILPLLIISCNKEKKEKKSPQSSETNEKNSENPGGKTQKSKDSKETKINNKTPKKEKAFCSPADLTMDSPSHNRGERQSHRHRLSYSFAKPPWKLTTKTISRKTRITAPVIIDKTGNIYVGDHKGFFKKISPKGKVLWSVKSAGKIWSRGGIDPKNLKVYFGSDDDHLYCVDMQTGKLLWKKQLFLCKPKRGADPEKVKCDQDSPILVLSSGNVIVGGKGVVAIDTKGEILWSHEIRSHVRSSPGVDKEGNIYFGTLAGEIVSLDSVGNLRWRYGLKGQCDSTPLLTDGCLVLIGCDNNKIHALNRSTGKIQWKLLGGGNFRSGGAAGADGVTYWGNLDRYLYAVKKNGRVLWKYKTGGRILSNPVVDNKGNILIVPEEKRVYLLSSTGKLLYSKNIKSISDSMPVVTKTGEIKLTTEKGNLITLKSK
jgi:outer membrane protein assembly factor BamB